MSGDRAMPHVVAPGVTTQRLRPHVVEIAVRGDLDIRTGKLVQEALESSLDDEATEMLSLHLGGVTFIDSTGLRVLIRARRAAKLTERVLVLTAPSQSVVRLLEVTGMDKLFDVVDG